MTVHLWPILFALFVWWSSTAAILYLNSLPPRTFRWSQAAATVVLGGALYGLHTSAADASVAGVYTTFASTLLIWGWLEITFYMGWVAGPRKIACADGCRGPIHFWHALMASLWHELAIVVAAVVVVAITHKSPNNVAIGTFFTLWWMHESARLNVFLGVPNRHEHFLPAHLAYLKSFFRHRSMNLLFPVSITVSTVVLAFIVQAALAAPAGSPAAHELVLIGTLMALAILEHWFLVLPLDAAKLWNWSVSPRPSAADETKIPVARQRGSNPTSTASLDLEGQLAPIRIHDHRSGLRRITVAQRRPL